MVEKRILVFLDASVMVAASHSSMGGSSLVMDICRGHRFRAAVSARVLLEARVNIADKFSEMELVRFYEQLAGLEPEIANPPSKDRMTWCAAIVEDKDAHVLAAALECGADYLLTLDRRHLITPAVSAATLPLRVMTPGDFLREIMINR